MANECQVTNNKNAIQRLIQIVEESLLSKEELITGLIATKKQIVIKGDNLTFALSTSEIDKIEMSKNERAVTSMIDLGECEKKLREEYHLDSSVQLIITKYDIVRSDSVATQVEYSIYRSDNPTEKLELSKCAGTTITVNSPFTVNNSTESLLLSTFKQGYDILNPNDSFYTDLCSSYDSENDTDLTIRERKTEIYEPNSNVCEDSCEVKMTVQCICEVKTEVNTDTEKASFGSKLKDSFFDFDTIFNIKVLKCIKLIFTWEGFKRNYLGYTNISISFLFVGLMSYYFIVSEHFKEELKNISIEINKVKAKILETPSEDNRQAPNEKVRKKKKKRKSKVGGGKTMGKNSDLGVNELFK